ncbi:hypothetical protein ES332_A13G002800v1 [Gossypium tomentosum]|uniref:Uncharacterized protein n=1 Tax=Gossypium tomentosum TaxID=34277 RepID=A0A5D2ME28_GOSTO|nr:hypothetical protein ES332_A13G002800v1 [Gossypium tomentosum]
MTNHQDQPRHTIIQMPEAVPWDFIEEKRDAFKSALYEVQNQGPLQGSWQGAKPLIQRVSPLLLNTKADFKKCFEPRLVAFGPLHHGKPEFMRSEQVKLKFAARFALDNGYTDDQELFYRVMAEIGDLRKCYNPEDIAAYNDERLAWMLFVDGCAVLCAVRYVVEGKFDELNTKADLLVFAQLDLFLLENQLPYKLLKILIGSAKDPKVWEQSITEFIAQNLMTNIEQESKHVDDNKDYAHLLERFRDQLLTGDKMKRDSSVMGRKLLSWGDSRKHRRTFRGPSTTNNLKNISFYCNYLGKLMIPRLLVDDSMASKFLNLVALEMCPDFKNKFEVTSYLCFMDSLIGSADDVKELRVSGVLLNYLGSDEEVAELFNKMSRDLVPDQKRYFKVTEDIHKYRTNPWTAALAKAFYTHFERPWTFFAFMGAIMGLLFSAIQAYFSLPQNKSSP